MIEVEKKGAGLWIVLNRPDVLNALHPEMIAAINRALDDARADQDLRAVVVSGRGRAFCAGADLKYNQSVSGQPGGNLAFVSIGLGIDAPAGGIRASRSRGVERNDRRGRAGARARLRPDHAPRKARSLGDMHANYSLVSRRRRIGEARAARWRAQRQAPDVLGRERVRPTEAKRPGPRRYCRWRRSADRVDRRAGCETGRQESVGAAAHESRNQPRQRTARPACFAMGARHQRIAQSFP